VSRLESFTLRLNSFHYLTSPSDLHQRSTHSTEPCLNPCKLIRAQVQLQSAPLAADRAAVLDQRHDVVTCDKPKQLLLGPLLHSVLGQYWQHQRQSSDPNSLRRSVANELESPVKGVPLTNDRSTTPRKHAISRDSNAQFTDRKNFSLNATAEERVFDLQPSDWMNRIGAPNRVYTYSDKPMCPTYPACTISAIAPDRVLDRHCRIEPGGLIEVNIIRS